MGIDPAAPPAAIPARSRIPRSTAMKLEKSTLALAAMTATALFLAPPPSRAFGSCAADGQIATRAQFDDILQDNQTLEDFESYAIGNGKSAVLNITSLDQSTVANGQGPGLVGAGARYSDPSGTNMQWNGNGYYHQTTRTILTHDRTAGRIAIEYTQFVDAMGIDFCGFSGYGFQGLVEVYDLEQNLVGSKSFQVVNGGPERVFFGWYHAAGIGRVIAYNQTNPDVAGSPQIDDHGYGDCEGVGTIYCDSNTNSTGAAAQISATGSASSSAGNLELTSTPVPNQNGIFFHGMNTAQNPFGNGFMCTTGDITRGLVTAAAGNVATYTYDNSDAKHSLASFVGTTRHFQHWFRDPMGGGALFNTSNAISIAIDP